MLKHIKENFAQIFVLTTLFTVALVGPGAFEDYVKAEVVKAQQVK